MPMEQNTSHLEDLMILELEKAMNSEFMIQMLRRNWEKEHNIHSLGNLIGEVYIHHIINKDGYGFEYYMTQIESLYEQLKERKISPENFNMQKSKLISIVIATKIGIDINKEITQEDMTRVKNYFLQEYVTNGYVSHSFPEAYIKPITDNGLIGSTEQRQDKPHDIQEIQNIFMSKGIASPLGGYPYYEGSGIYYEHDFTKVFQHAVDSPEWFNWFTSSDHTTTYHSDIETQPYILRDEENCRRNVNDLCQNAELSSEETKNVLDFYTKTYDKFSSPKLNVALISKKLLRKNDISKAVPSDMDLFSTMTYVLKDGAKQYIEHQGNVYTGTISPENFRVSIIPNAYKYIKAEQYSRETKEHLANPQSNLAILKKAEENKSRMTSSMIEKVESTKAKLEQNWDLNNQKQQKQEINFAAKKGPEFNSASFTRRSDSEIKIANQIKEKNMAIKQQKEQQRNLEKPKVKTLTKSNNNGNSPSSGVANTLILSLIVSFVAGALFMVLYMLIGR